MKQILCILLASAAALILPACDWLGGGDEVEIVVSGAETLRFTSGVSSCVYRPDGAEHRVLRSGGSETVTLIFRDTLIGRDTSLTPVESEFDLDGSTYYLSLNTISDGIFGGNRDRYTARTGTLRIRSAGEFESVLEVDAGLRGARGVTAQSREVRVQLSIKKRAFGSQRCG